MISLIKLEDLYFSYGKNEVLKGINLNIENGDFIALYGENGSGKSTLLKILLKELNPTSGKINYHNSIKPGSIGYVPQLMPQDMLGIPITVEEVVKLALYPKNRGIKKLNPKDEQRVDEVLNIVGMKDFKKELFKNLSGGQKQRVLIGKSLLGDIELLFLDEPTNGIDVNMKKTLGSLLNHLNKFHQVTIFVITHERKFIEEYANRSLVLENGRLS